jgi:3-oxoadipate enol-lactonase
MSNEPASAVITGFIPTHGHGRMHYREAGRGDALILIPTNGGSAYQYDGVMAALAKSFRVIAWDMPGHGDSDAVARHYSIEDYSCALAAFMDALGIKAAHISGCSVGGSISVCFASQYPQRTLSAVIVETPFRSFDEWGARWSHTEGNFGIPTQNAHDIKERVAHVDDALVTRWNVDRNKAGAKLMMSVMWAIRQFDVQSAVTNIRCPAMILYGRRGPTIANRDRFAAAAPSLPIEVIENSGHFPMLDAPDVFAATLAKFCTAAKKH